MLDCSHVYNFVRKARGQPDDDFRNNNKKEVPPKRMGWNTSNAYLLTLYCTWLFQNNLHRYILRHSTVTEYQYLIRLYVLSSRGSRPFFVSCIEVGASSRSCFMANLLFTTIVLKHVAPRSLSF